MNTQLKYTRRSFVATLAGMAVVPVLGRAADLSAAASPETRPHKEADKFSLGIAGYSMRDFSVDETLWWLNRWQLHRWAIKDVHLPVSSGPEVIAALQAKCKAAGVTIYGAGVLYLKSESEVTNAFAYAQRLGATIIIGVPNPELLPFVEKAVQASNIRLAIHNHGPDMDLYPTPKSVYDHIKNLDSRIGICLDIGHTQRCGVDPSDALGEFASRICDIHIKDVDKASFQNAMRSVYQQFLTSTQQKALFEAIKAMKS